MTHTKLVAGFALGIMLVPAVGLAKPGDAAEAKAQRTVERQEAAAQRAADRAEEKAQRVTDRTEAKAQRETDRAEAKAERIAERQDKFCEKATAYTTTITDRLTKGKDKMEDRFARAQEKTLERKEAKMAHATDAREEADARRAEHYANLLAKATTDEQKAAVETYQTEVEAAVAARRTRIDTAFNTFWDEAVVQLGAQKDAYALAYDNFVADVEAAVATASAECADSDSPRDAAKALRTTLQDMQQTFREERRSALDVKKEIIALRADFRAETKEAIDAYRATVKASRTKMQAAFGTTDNAVDSGETL